MSMISGSLDEPTSVITRALLRSVEENHITTEIEQFPGKTVMKVENNVQSTTPKIIQENHNTVINCVAPL